MEQGRSSQRCSHRMAQHQVQFGATADRPAAAQGSTQNRGGLSYRRARAPPRAPPCRRCVCSQWLLAADADAATAATAATAVSAAQPRALHAQPAGGFGTAAAATEAAAAPGARDRNLSPAQPRALRAQPAADFDRVAALALLGVHVPALQVNVVPSELV